MIDRWGYKICLEQKKSGSFFVGDVGFDTKKDAIAACVDAMNMCKLDSSDIEYAILIDKGGLEEDISDVIVQGEKNV